MPLNRPAALVSDETSTRPQRHDAGPHSADDAVGGMPPLYWTARTHVYSQIIRITANSNAQRANWWPSHRAHSWGQSLSFPLTPWRCPEVLDVAVSRWPGWLPAPPLNFWLPGKSHATSELASRLREVLILTTCIYSRG